MFYFARARQAERSGPSLSTLRLERLLLRPRFVFAGHLIFNPPFVFSSGNEWLFVFFFFHLQFEWSGPLAAYCRRFSIQRLRFFASLSDARFVASAHLGALHLVTLVPILVIEAESGSVDSARTRILFTLIEKQEIHLSESSRSTNEVKTKLPMAC